MRGSWDPWPATPSSALLEITALLKALQTLEEVRECQVLWRSDNAQLFWDVNRMKSARESLNVVLRRIADLLRTRKVVLRVEWIPREQNTLADQLSKIRDNDWMLHPRLFERICSITKVEPTLDCFATAQNRLVPRFISRFREEGCVDADFFRQSLKGEVIWANPPFNLMGSVLRHLRAHPTKGILVVPVWVTQPWWPLLQDLVVQPPLILPRSESTFLPGVRQNWVGLGAARFDCWAVPISSVVGDRALALHLWGNELKTPSTELLRWASRPQNRLGTPKGPVTILV